MWTKLKFMKCLYLCNNSVIAAVRTLCVNSKEVSDLLKISSVKISASFSDIRTAVYKYFEYIFNHCTVLVILCILFLFNCYIVVSYAK